MTINQALFEAAEAFKSGDVLAAKRLLSKIIQIEPNQPDANSNMGAILVASGDLEEALPFIKTALEANFSVGQYWFNYIDALFKLDRFAEALELMVIARDKGCKGPAFDELEEKLGSTEVELQNKIRKLKELDEDGPLKYYFVLFGIGEALHKLGKPEEAIEAYNKALSIKPDFAEAYNNMGNALKDQGKLEEALETYNKATSIKPDYAEAYSNIGNAFKDQGKLEEAIEAYNKALSIKPDYAEAASNLLTIPYGCLSEQQVDLVDRFLREYSGGIEPPSKLRFMEANYLAHKKDFGAAFDKFIEANSLKRSGFYEEVQNSRTSIHEHYVRISNWVPHTFNSTQEQIKKLFILGPSRSGKSSLEHMLKYNKKVMANYEAINLTSIIELNVNQELNRSSIFENVYHKKEKDLLDLNFEAIISTNPYALFHLDQICEAISGCYFIFIERNELDLASEIFSTDYVLENFYSYDPADIMQYLKAYNLTKEVFLTKLPAQTLSVSYENIVMDQASVIEKINRFMNIDFSIKKPSRQRPIKTIKSPFRTYFNNLHPIV